MNPILALIHKVWGRRQSKRHLSDLLINHARDIMAVLQADGTLVYINPAVEATLGYKASEGTGHSLFDFIHPDDRPAMAARLQRHAEPGNVPPDGLEMVIYRFAHRDGGWRHMEAVGRPLPPEEGYGQMVIAARDVSERVAREQELKEAQRTAEQLNQLKSSFLSNMSHELRTPLVGILGPAAILAEEVLPEQRPMAQMIHANGNRLLDTLSTIIDFSLLESDNLVMHPEPLDVRLLVAAEVPHYMSKAEAQRLNIVFDASDEPLWALVDRTGLGRVMAHLVSNALKFTETGTITLRLHGTNERVELEVADEGIGMDAAFVSQMFEAFMQESTGMARIYEGLGLGLTVSKLLVDRMNGTIRVQSTKGKGSTFTISLPRVAPEVPVPETPVRSSTRRNVLVVDDDESVRLMLRHILVDSHKVVEASSADEVMTLMQTKHGGFDLVLLDLNLGGGASGVDLVPILREHNCCTESRMVAVTGYVLPEDREAALAAGFDAHLAKPFTRTNVTDLLASLNVYV